MGWIYSDSLSSPQLEGGKQSVIRNRSLGTIQFVHFIISSGFCIFNAGLEIYVISFVFTVVEDLHSSSMQSFVIDIFCVPIL